MNNTGHEDTFIYKAARLLDIIKENNENNIDNTKYVAFILESYFADGFHAARNVFLRHKQGEPDENI